MLRGNVEAAIPPLHEGLRLCRDMGGCEVQDTLLYIAAKIAYRRGTLLQAAQFLGSAEAHPAREHSGGIPGHDDIPALIESLREQCDSVALDDAWTIGRSLPLDQAITSALNNL